jgi:light-regulated signal transduction histidine kinase (bacteriophytochrome)
VLLRDVTEYLELQEERQKNHMMKMLHATVSHDMISPIHNIKYFASEMYNACLDRKLNEVEKYH